MTRATADPATRARLGRPAGIVSRLLAGGLDLIAIVVIGFAILLVVSTVVGLFTRSVEFLTPPQPARGILAVALVIAYLGYGWGFGGSTFGTVVMGLRVTGRDGTDIPAWKGVLRAVLCVAFLPGILWSAVSHRNASVQDLLLGTVVVHDWGFAARHAETDTG